MRLITLLVAALLSWSAAAAIDTYKFNSVEQEQQYRELTEQLRCPKCQNNRHCRFQRHHRGRYAHQGV
ncbi:Cytochrome c-type biogenesis protein CcmH precursor [Serratia fonticola]|uniref:Cytochrome c-type biogenesis protein n=1 Tax=Serratia fonticola TaxID=47917 RepID=A0A4V6KVU1_SERFO|nr:Cytochrome c-type biogenesis protein CcmH precursor [Serratia fonticola]